MFQKGVKEEPTYEFSFEKSDVWNFNPDAIQTDSVGNRSVLITAENPYGPTFQIALSEFAEKGVSELMVRVECTESDSDNALQMVFDQGNENGGYAWESDAFKLQYKLLGPNWGIFCYKLQETQSESDVLKVYPWLPEGKPERISKMAVRLR
jgi:hypothetical protein